jgi:hypothetical protein
MPADIVHLPEKVGYAHAYINRTIAAAVQALMKASSAIRGVLEKTALLPRIRSTIIDFIC